MSKLFHPEQVLLSNGIPVVLQHYEGTVAATYWWVKVGSVDEGPQEAGFAHFLEHMLFKDAAAKETGRASTGQMARAIESLGGDINAYTSFDQTVYHVTCAAHHWEKVLDAFGAIAKPQRFLRADFEREREVILEELRKNEDSPGRRLFQELFSATFRRHPYGRPVIGFVSTLKEASVKQIESFYRRHYVSGKMGLILVGPIEDGKGLRRKTILKRLEKCFGRGVFGKRSSGRSVIHAGETDLRKRTEVKVQKFDVNTPTLSLSFRVPELMHDDIPALDILAGVLGMGELSRLYQNLFYDRSLVTDVSGGLYVPSDPGMLYFQAEMDSVSRIPEVAEGIFKECRRLIDEGPSQEELTRVVTNAESERLYATQTADGMAGRLGFLRFVLGDLDFDQKYIADLRSVDAARIREVARIYLDHRRMSVVAQIPKSVNFDEEAFVEDMVDSAAATLQSRSHLLTVKKAATGSKVAEMTKLPSGMRVVYFERPGSHVFSVHAAVLGGVRLEQDWGSSNMLALTWAKGTRSRSSREISEIVEGSAANLEGFSGRSSVGLQLTGLARDWNKLSELFTDVLLNPSFPADEVLHSRRVTEDSIRGIEDHSSQLCSKLFLEALYEKHPYGKLIYGSLESLQAIYSEKLSAFHRAWVRPERLVISFSGPVKRQTFETWVSDLDRRSAENAEKATGLRAIPLSLPDEPALKAPRWIEKNMKREQIHILIGGLGSTVCSGDRHAMKILQTILGGQSGRLFVELREKKSLAYSVSPVSFEGIERGYVGTYIACAPQKKEEAAAAMRVVLEKLAEKGPVLSEMVRAKEFFLGRRSMDLQGDASIASYYGLEELYRVPLLTESEMIRKVRAVSSREVKEVCRRYLVEPSMVTSIVG